MLNHKSGVLLLSILISFPHLAFSGLLSQSSSDQYDEYSITKEIRYKKDPKLHKKSIWESKQGNHFEAPRKKLILKVTVWDVPVMQSFIRKQSVNPRSAVAEELRRNLKQEHTEYTQFSLSARSYVGKYFEWANTQFWLEDKNGKTYLPVKTRESTQSRKIPAETTKTLGRTTKKPGYTITQDFGKIFFEKIDLKKLAPVTFHIKNKKKKISKKFTFDDKGRMPEYVDPAIQNPPVAELELTPAEVLKLKKNHFKKATEFYKAKQFELAIKEWQEVLKLDPNHRLSKTKIKKAQKELYYQKPAKEDLSMAEKKKQMKIHFLIASEFYQKGEYADAIEEWEKVLAYDPEHKLSIQKIEKARENLTRTESP